MTTQKDVRVGLMKGYRGGTARGSCPPHTPILIEASRGGNYVARCLACGVRGPEREDDWEAKLAFDESIE